MAEDIKKPDSPTGTDANVAPSPTGSQAVSPTVAGIQPDQQAQVVAPPSDETLELTEDEKKNLSEKSQERFKTLVSRVKTGEANLERAIGMIRNMEQVQTQKPQTQGPIATQPQEPTYQPTTPQAQPQQPHVPDWGQANEQFYEQFTNQPLSTIAQAVNLMIENRLRSEREVRSKPDFQSLETTFYNISDEDVIRAAQNPQMIRYYMARALRPTQTSQPQSNPNPQPQPTQQTTPVTVEDLTKALAQSRNMGRQEVVQAVQNQPAMSLESTQSPSVATTETFEPDEVVRDWMRKLNITKEEAQDFLKRLDFENKKPSGGF